MSERQGQYDGADGIPDGINADDCRQNYWNRHATAISVVVLGSLLLLALTGFAGGGAAVAKSAEFNSAKLSVEYPRTLRNGELFEMQVTAEAHRNFKNAILTVEPALWRSMTINTMLPAASEESYGAGGIRFVYGEVKAGKSLSVKIDGQINPPLFAGNSGKVALYDGDRPVGELMLSIRVWP